MGEPINKGLPTLDSRGCKVVERKSQLQKINRKVMLRAEENVKIAQSTEK